MPWVRIDDQFPDHPKIREVGPESAWLYLSAVAYLNRYRTTKVISARTVRRLTTVPHWKKAVRRLVDAGLWREVDGGFEITSTIHVGLPTHRPKIPNALRLAVYERDGYQCLICGTRERLSLDHIWPWSLGGEDTYENLQTLCVSCNSRKGAN